MATSDTKTAVPAPSEEALAGCPVCGERVREIERDEESGLTTLRPCGCVN